MVYIIQLYACSLSAVTL